MELRDERVILRPWQKDDAAAVYEACQDPEILHWIPFIPRPYSQEDARAFVTGELDLGPHQFAIEERGSLVGSIGIVVNGQTRTGHIGYWCVRSARGRGVMSGALRLLCRYALDDLKLERLELITDPDNLASQRVAAKAGFQHEGVLRSHLPHPDGRRRDSFMFSLLPGELAAQ
ncbi:MAG: GNAT family N-acetyltransferase [Gaiellaceae bacterium]